MKIRCALSWFVLLFISFQVQGMKKLRPKLSDLPLDILGEIFKFTEIKTLCVFGESCKTFLKISNIVFLRRYVASLDNGYKTIPLVFAAKRCDLFALQKILPLKIKDVNKVDRYGRTPLYCAVEDGHIEIVKLLLKYSANVDTVGSDCETPLYWAVFNDHLEIVKLLLEHKADVNKTSDGETPLYCAVENGQLEIVKLLLEHKADVNKTSYGETPLFWAALKDKKEVVKILLKHSADVNKARFRETPLWWATRKGHTEIVKLLLKHKADINITDSDDLTPLCWARYYGHSKIIKILKARKQKNKIRNIPILKFLGKIL